MANKLISIDRHDDKPDRLYWTVLLFPGSDHAVGFCLKKAFDGNWTCFGQQIPFYVNHDRYWEFHVGKWLLWVIKRRFRIPDELKQKS